MFRFTVRSTIRSTLRPAVRCAGAVLPAPLLAIALGLSLTGCATIGDAQRTQQLEIHAVLDHREVLGVGCVLSNDAGRWFVVAPGRVTVARSQAPLAVDCARQGSGSARDEVGSRFDTAKLIGNVIISAGLGYYVDRHSGAGFSYPTTLTVLMEGQGQNAPAAGAPDGAPAFGSLIF